ncbi:uncharacterized protein LOC126832721 isoform X2 [Adelges cooleyi]|nr:uncharacterized protein LOC126832721 isoform X2 [Adelges cooleyi]XP_050419550.1 uncharacterized protein LOC126832721 isoform X2 [Adelges cooleyi]XP_050419552.1 uncharacterized protein LOC126832721 isoform X2 [Adelges cooleyi]
MKLCYTLIACAFVNVAFAFNDHRKTLIEDHKKQVVVTNNHIDKAFCKGVLSNAVKKVICGVEQGEYKYSMVDMVFMMAILPVSESLYDFDLTKLQQYIKYQTDMQQEILDATTLSVPELAPNYNYGDRLFPQLRQQRKYAFVETIYRLIINNIVLPGPDFNEARFSDLCRAVGLFNSVVNPDNYIVSAEVGDQNTCILTAVDNSISRYRPIGDRVYRVDVDPAIELRDIMVGQLRSCGHQ